MKKIRKNFMVTEDVADYIKLKAGELGISEGGFINVAISEYKKQGESLNAINALNSLILKMESIEGVKNDVEK